MHGKLLKLDKMMQEVGTCDKCTKNGCGIESPKLLRNLIAEYPDAPHYGGIPSTRTDWATRLEARIAYVLKDWGAADSAFSLRSHFEDLIATQGWDSEVAWRKTVQNRPNPSRTHKNIIQFFNKSATKAAPRPLPADFLDHIYFTNAVLCFRRRGGVRGNHNIDMTKSIENCHPFLLQQIKIVRPVLIVAAGKDALESFGLIPGLESLSGQVDRVIKHVRKQNPDGFIEIIHKGLPLRILPVHHPAAHTKTARQIKDYAFIWKALHGILKDTASDWFDHVFPGS